MQMPDATAGAGEDAEAAAAPAQMKSMLFGTVNGVIGETPFSPNPSALE